MVEPTFGAPPLLNELIQRGDLPAVLNFWHYNARLKAAGMRELLTAVEILPALGVERPIPLLGWVFNRSWANENRDAVAGFLRASYSAKHLLLESDEEWVRLEPNMKVSDAATAAALRDAYRARNPPPVRRGGSGGRGASLRDSRRRRRREARRRERHPHAGDVLDRIRPGAVAEVAPKRAAFWLRSLSLLGFVAVWQLAAVVAASDLVPSPAVVMELLWKHTESGELGHHLQITLARVAVAFAIAMAVGTAIGILMGRSERVDMTLDGILVLGLNIPALVTIILCYLWFGLTEVAAVLAVAVNKIPTVVVTVREGAKAVDRNLMEVSKVYRVGRLTTLFKVYLPQLYPYLMAAARSGLALIWKIVLVVELLGRSNGVGFQLNIFFQFFDIGSILAYTLAFAAVILLVEAVGMRPLERRLTRWRG